MAVERDWKGREGYWDAGDCEFTVCRAALAFIAAVEAVEDIDGRAIPTWTANSLFEHGAFMREASRRAYTDALAALRRAVLDLP